MRRAHKRMLPKEHNRFPTLSTKFYIKTIQPRKPLALLKIASSPSYVVATRFFMHIWCRLILQVTTILNLLQQLHINPRLSAEAQINGVFDYNATLLAPPGKIGHVRKSRKTKNSVSTRRWLLVPHQCSGTLQMPHSLHEQNKRWTHRTYRCIFPAWHWHAHNILIG